MGRFIIEGECNEWIPQQEELDKILALIGYAAGFAKAYPHVFHELPAVIEEAKEWYLSLAKRRIDYELGIRHQLEEL